MTLNKLQRINLFNNNSEFPRKTICQSAGKRFSLFKTTDLLDDSENAQLTS